MVTTTPEALPERLRRVQAKVAALAEDQSEIQRRLRDRSIKEVTWPPAMPDGSPAR